MDLLKITQSWHDSLEEYAATDFAAYSGLNCLLGALRCSVTLIQKVAGKIFSDKSLEQAAGKNAGVALIETVPWFGGYKAKQHVSEKHTKDAEYYLKKIKSSNDEFFEKLRKDVSFVLKHPEHNPTAILENALADLERKKTTAESELVEPAWTKRQSYRTNVQIEETLKVLKQRSQIILQCLKRSDAP